MDKKIIVIKAIEDDTSLLSFNKKLSAILRLEGEEVFINLYLSVVNCPCASAGEYYLYVIDVNKKVYSFNLGARPTNFRNSIEWSDTLFLPLCSLIVSKSQSIPNIVAIGREQGCTLDFTTLKKLVAEKCLDDRKQLNKANCVKQTERAIDFNKSRLEAYDDEAVATENYFEIEQKINQKLDYIKEKDNEQFEYKDGFTYHQNCKEEKEEQTCPYRLLDEKNASQSQDEQLTDFFLSKEQDVMRLFRKYPEYTQLKGVFPDSKWVKINYTKKDFYVVGIINENGKRKYLCYGIPSKYSPTPPESLQGYSTFIPLSIFDTHGDGFFMMFQECSSGKCVFPKPVATLS